MQQRSAALAAPPIETFAYDTTLNARLQVSF
jgi:hypothetical protein